MTYTQYCSNLAFYYVNSNMAKCEYQKVPELQDLSTFLRYKNNLIS